MKRICVFCGSSSGARPEYQQLAIELGRALVRQALVLVYGGARTGLMGVLADTVLQSGGQVIGVMPEFLVEKEVAHCNLTELKLVSSMHERKQQLADLSDGFIALPGGLGTLEEFIEVLTWAQLGLHQKPCGLLNVQGYYDRLIEFLDHGVTERFVTATFRSMLLVAETPEQLFDSFTSYRAPVIDRWLDRTVT